MIFKGTVFQASSSSFTWSSMASWLPCLFSLCGRCFRCWMTTRQSIKIGSRPQVSYKKKNKSSLCCTYFSVMNFSFLKRSNKYTFFFFAGLVIRPNTLNIVFNRSESLEYGQYVQHLESFLHRECSFFLNHFSSGCIYYSLVYL